MINGFDQHSSSLLASEDLVQTQYRGHGHGHNNANGTAHNNNNNTNTTDTNTNNSRAVFKKTYPVVQVEAPETLPEGYTFDVEVNHEILTVTVVSLECRVSGIECSVWYHNMMHSQCNSIRMVQCIVDSEKCIVGLKKKFISEYDD